MNPAKPTALRRLEGNRGNRPFNPNEPEPDHETPKPPDFLTDVARAEWERVVPALERTGMLSSVDRAALVMYCEAWSDFVEARHVVAKEGQYIQGSRGQIRHPMTLIAKDAQAIMKSLIVEFGLSPSARARMQLPGGSKDDLDAEKILNG